MLFDYTEITSDILIPLKPRTAEVIERRFGLGVGHGETLQSIGDSYGITRERVRQIEGAGLKKIKPRLERHDYIFSFFNNQLEVSGGVRREKEYLPILGPRKHYKHILFLLNLYDEVEHIGATDDFHTLWTKDPSILEKAQDLIEAVSAKLEEEGKPVDQDHLEREMGIEPQTLFGLLSVSKKVRRGPQDLWGFSYWPEVNPRSSRDRSYIVLKQIGKPLHFREIAEMINEGRLFEAVNVSPQTVHNELIKSDKFILVGRGTYGLKEWGYESGTVKEVIERVLREEGPLSQDEIMDRVLDRRMVKRNTVLFNLRNEEAFSLNEEGTYELSS